MALSSGKLLDEASQGKDNVNTTRMSKNDADKDAKSASQSTSAS